MPPAATPLPATIRAKLAAFAARERNARLWRGLAEAVIVFDLAVLAAALVLWALAPATAGRVALSLAVYAVALGVLGWRVVGERRRRGSLRHVAERFERAAAHRLRERLLSAVEFSESAPPGTSAWMAEQTLKLAAAEVAPLEPAKLVDTRPTAMAWRMAGLAACALLVVTVVAPRRVWLVLNPLAAPVVAAAGSFAVSPGDCRRPAGASVEIRAQARRALDRAVLIVRWQDGFREELAMARAGDTNVFTQTLSRLSQGCRYAVKADGLLSPEFQVIVEHPPRLERVRLRVTPPAYARLPLRDAPDGSADVLAGSRVRVTAQLAGSPARAVEWLPGGAAPRPMTLRSNFATLEFAPATNVTYTLRLIGENGLTNQPLERWSLRVLPDEPPTATLAGRGLDAGTVGPDESLLLDAAAQDDVGLARLELLATAGGQTFRQSLPLETRPASGGRGQEAVAQFTFNLAERRLEIGDELLLQAEATDLAGNTGRSVPLRLTLGTPAAAEAAQLARRLRERVAETDAALAAFQRARAQWTGFARAIRAGNTEAGGELELVRQQLDEVRAGLTRAATNLLADSARERHELVPYLANLATAMGTYAAAQHRVFENALEAVAETRGLARDAALTRARDVLDNAEAALADARVRVALAPATLEAEALVNATETAQGRYQRGLPVLRAAKGWDKQPPSGLDATFFAGQELKGEPVLKKVDVPRFENLEVPKAGRENWSARYTGEIKIPEKGGWNFALTANDGVRLILNGQNLLPGEAWAAQGTREHKATAELSAGWHPLTLEFFQSGGQGKLQLRFGKDRAELRETVAADFRVKPAPSAGPPPVAGLTPAALDATSERLARSLAATARVGADLARFREDVPSERMQRLAAAKEADATALARNAARLPEWQAADAQAAESQADTLVNAAREAHRLLRDRLGDERWRVQREAEFQALRTPMLQLGDAVERMKPAEWNRERQDLQAVKHREITAAQAWAGELRRGLEDTGRELFAEARDPQAGLARRAEALRASLRLEQDAAKSVSKLEDLLAAAPGQDKVTEKLQRELEKLDESLNQLRRVNELEREAREARLAETGLRRAAARQPDALAAAARELAVASRQRGDFHQAGEWEKAAAQDNPSELLNRLFETARRAHASPEPLGQALPPPMQESARRLERDTPTEPQTASTLAKARLGLALEGERLRREGQPQTSAAYARLGFELGALLRQPERLTAPNVRPLAERAAALAKERDAQARERTAERQLSAPPPQWAADSAPEPEAEALAARLDALSLDAGNAAGTEPRRAPLLGDLRELAALDGGQHVAPGSPGERPQDAPSQQAPRQLAAEAAAEATDEIQAAPAQPVSYQAAARTLADGAASLRLASAAAQAAAAEAAARAAADAARAARLAALRAPQPAGPPAPGAEVREGDFTRSPGHALGLTRAVSGRDQADWARLREQLRDAGQGGGLERFSEEQQEAIRAYFRRLANEK